MRPWIGYTYLLGAVVVLWVLLASARVLAPSPVNGHCIILYEQSTSSAVIRSVRALLCYKGLLDAVLAIFVLVLMRLIAFSTTHKHPMQMQETSSSMESSTHAIASSMMSKLPSCTASKNSCMIESSGHSYIEHTMDNELVAEVLFTRFDYHDIFLSHCGNQKDFVSDLHKMLCSAGYTAFSDITHHRLPPGSICPPLIKEAAAKCRLAIVVLSHDFLLSKWSMIELCAFVQEQSSSADQQPLTIKILPLFYKLSPFDLVGKENLEKWQDVWKIHAEFDPKRVDVTRWKDALDVLSRHEGVYACDPLGVDGTTATHMQNILSSISKIVKPTTKHETAGVQGKERLCKIINTKFQELQSGTPSRSILRPHVPSHSARVCVLGMYGLPGSGKSSLSKCLCNHYIREFHGRTIYLRLPTNPTQELLATISKELLVNATDFSDGIDYAAEADSTQVHSLLQRHLQRFRVFLVVDNITPDPLAREFVLRVLKYELKAGSKVLLVARSYSLLQQLLFQGDNKYACGSVKVPTITKEEAIQVAHQNATSAHSRAAVVELDYRDQEILKEVIPVSTVGMHDQRVYLPLLVNVVRSRLREEGYSLHY